MNRRWICNDLWMDMFPFFNHRQLGLKLALLSPRFDVLVDKHFGGKCEMTIWKPIRIHKDSEMPKLNAVPLAPDCPLPNKIRFKNLQITYIDPFVIAFLRSNKQIFDNGRGTNLYLNVFHHCNRPRVQRILNDVFLTEILPIFAPNIRRLDFPNDDHLRHLLGISSPSLLIDLNQLNSINSDNLLPAAIDEFDGPNATSAEQILSKWLHTPRKDGQPKRLCCCIGYASQTKKWMKKFKQAFLHATTCASHILSLTLPESAQIVPFELVNERTREKLTLLKKEGGDIHWEYSQWLMKRCPIGQMVQWEDENLDNLNSVNIFFRGVTNYIGPFSPPAKCAEVKNN